MLTDDDDDDETNTNQSEDKQIYMPMAYACIMQDSPNQETKSRSSKRKGDPNVLYMVYTVPNMVMSATTSCSNYSVESIQLLPSRLTVVHRPSQCTALVRYVQSVPPVVSPAQARREDTTSEAA